MFGNTTETAMPLLACLAGIYDRWTRAMVRRVLNSSWNLIQTTEEVARAFIVAASAATAQSTCMSIVYSSKLRWEWQPNAEASATILENHEGVLILSRPVRTLQSKSPHGSKAAMIEALAEVVGLHVTLHVYLCIMHPLSIYCFTYTMQNN